MNDYQKQRFELICQLVEPFSLTDEAKEELFAYVEQEVQQAISRGYRFGGRRNTAPDSPRARSNARRFYINGKPSAKHAGKIQIIEAEERGR